jgi:hypothetical protein
MGESRRARPGLERAPVAVGEEHVVIGWPLARDGRKLRAGSAVLGAGGEVLAIARGADDQTAPGLRAAEVGTARASQSRGSFLASQAQKEPRI